MKGPTIRARISLSFIIFPGLVNVADKRTIG
jgi:hypothetical protein